MRRKYRIVQTRNPLTEEIYFFIEQRILFFWFAFKIKNKAYQEYFGCDEDGMFGQLPNAIKVLKYLKGVYKVERKVVTNITFE